MNKRFDNQVAVITGAADGLGKGIAMRLGSEGAALVLLDVNKHKLDETVGGLQQAGYQVLGIPTDISNEAAVQRAMEQAVSAHDKIDILVNSAGIVGPTNTPITAYPTESFDAIYGINLRGAFLVTKYAIQHMEMMGYGRILLIASIAGKEGNPFMAGYSSMKAGVIGMVKGIGKEFAEKGITVNGLAPAVIKTAMNEDTAPEQMAYMVSKIPMNRLGTVEEVSAIAAWIVSPEASFTTGFIYDISGGRATY